MSLAGDGASDELFFLLWAKNEWPSSRPRQERHHHAQHVPASTPWHLPQTVVYKASSPCAWYFTSAKTGKILKKSKHNLLSRRIEEEFTKQTLAGDIVAYYLTLPNAFREDDDQHFSAPSAASSSSLAAPGAAGNDDDARIEYFDRAGLHNFLFNRSKDCGLLQQFIEPQGPRNTVIRAIWSPKLCIAERRVNLRNIWDRRYGLYERAVTYEGPDHHSQATPLKGHVLSTRIQHVCEKLVEHVAEITLQKQCIARCVLNFKVDSRGRLFFLWSSSIRLEDPIPMLPSCHLPPRPSSMPQHLTTHQQQEHGHRQQHQRFPYIGPPQSNPPRPTQKDDEAFSLSSQLALPLDIQLTTAASHQHRSHPPFSFPQPLFSQKCPSCYAKTAPERFYVVTYSMVGMLHEKTIALARAARRARRHLVEEGKNDSEGKEDKKEVEEEVPPLLQALLPEMRNGTAGEVYRRCKHDATFMQKRVKVCEDCFLKHADVACEKIVRQVGSQHQSPQQLQTRRESGSESKGLGVGEPQTAAKRRS
eukprot:evm.model.NODE_14596_length_8023_cov_27.736881.4